MVLPQPAAHDESGQAVGWLDEIALTLRLSAGAALVLVDKATPARLGDLRTLRHDFLKIGCPPRRGQAGRRGAGSTIALTPGPEDAEWLNLRRGQFADRKLKVVLFCSEETTLALKFHAPDFYDWIGRQKECPPGPVPFAVRGIRAAFEAEWPVAWTGSLERSRVEETVRAAFPGEELVWLSAEDSFDDVVKGMEASAIVLVEADTERRLRRARWARAAAQRQSRVVLLVGAQEAPRFWPVHNRQRDLAEAYEKLADVGVATPGAAAAMLDLEPEAVELLAKIGAKGHTTSEELLAEAWGQLDSGAALCRLAESSKWFTGSDDPLRMRAHASRTARRSFSGHLLRNFRHLSHTLPDTDNSQPIWIESVLARRPDDEPGLFVNDFGLLFVAAARLARLGEGDVIMWTLQAVKDKDVASELVPVLAEVGRGTNEDDLTKKLRAVAATLEQNWKPEEAPALDARAVALLAMLLLGAAVYFVAAHGPAIGLATARALLVLVFSPLALLWLAKSISRLLRRVRDSRLVLERKSQLDLIKKALGPAHEDWASRIQEMLDEAQANIADEHMEKAEQLAREAVQSASLQLKHTPLHREATILLASILRAKRERQEAEELIAPLFAAQNGPLPKDLLLLEAQLLAETGRAALAVQQLLHLTGADLPSTANLRQERDTPGADAVSRTRILLEPSGVLADEPEAHLTLVDALLKQGRYPEALLVARQATGRFADREEKAVSELKVRCLDLERRTGAASAG
ncbi:MAG: hypothetical protein R3F14_46040 [Polyangiaceae bacterium]